MSYARSKKSMVISIIAIVLSIVAFSAVFFGLSGNDDTKTVNSSSFSIGAIDAEGKAIDSKLSLYTKDKNTIEGLEITIVDEPTITYQVFFYDEDGNFVSASESLDTDFDATTIPEGASTFRIVITPDEVDGEAVEITTLNKSTYAKQLEVTFNK